MKPSSRVSTFLLKDDGIFPNNHRLPLIVFHQAVLPDDFEIHQLFKKNGWSVGGWRAGIYTFHHYHSTAHEVLGIFRGWANVQFGGENGISQRVEAGDVVLIPAGVGNCL